MTPSATPPIPMLGEILSLTAALVWAVAMILFRTASLETRPLVLNFFKNVVGIVLLASTLLLLGGFGSLLEISSRDFWLLGLSAVIGLYAGDTLLFAGLKRIGASLPFLLSCLYAPTAVFFSWLLLGESLADMILVGGIAITAGIFLVSTDRLGLPEGVSRSDLLAGVLFGTTAPLLFALGLVITKEPLAHIPILPATLVRMVIGTAPLAFHLLLTGRTPEIVDAFRPSERWRILLPASVLGTYLGMLSWLGGIKYTEASTASLLNQASPLFGIPLAALFLGERLTWRKIVGGMLAMGGILVIFLR